MIQKTMPLAPKDFEMPNRYLPYKDDSNGDIGF